MKVNFVTLNSANVSAQNTSEDLFKITANVQVSEGNVPYIDGGRVTDGDTQVAEFGYHGEGHLSITYYGVDVATQNSINTEVNEFVAAAKEAAGTLTISIES